MKKTRIVFVALSLLVLLVPLSATASGAWTVTDENPITVNGITVQIVAYYDNTVTLNISAGSDTKTVVYGINNLPEFNTVFLDGKYVTVSVARCYVVESVVSADITIVDDDGQVLVLVRDLEGNPVQATIGYWDNSSKEWFDKENHTGLHIAPRESWNVTRIRAYASGYAYTEREVIMKYPPETYFMFLVPLDYVPPPPNVPGFPWECWFR